jgi:hypothetical protein
MNKDLNRYFAIALGSTIAEVRTRLGEPDCITPRRSEQQWFYEQGRFALTFAGSEPRLTRIALRMVGTDRGDMQNSQDQGEIR